MRRWTLFLICCASGYAPFATADEASALAGLRSGCAGDAQKLCAGVPSGGGRILACLKAHKEEFSAQCKQAAQAANLNNNATSSAAPAPIAPAATSPAASPSGAAASSSAGTSGRTTHAAKESPGSFLRMKQVQIIDQGMDKVQAPLPAFDLMIPSAWNFKGNVAFGGGQGGCFSDMFAVSWDATNADSSVAFQGAPTYSWQYADDPAVLKKLTDPNRRALGAGGKPCPVLKPMKAEAYIRQYVLKALPSGSTIVSVEPFPELNQIARKQMGLPPGDGGTGSGAQTDAIRARAEFQKDGKAQEGWLAVAVVTRIYREGRGSFYDSHAIDLMALRMPKGQLDANDKLFKVMVSSVRPEPKWQAYSGGIMAKLLNAEAQKEAAQDKIIADLQRYAAQTIMDVTANQFQGSMNSAHAFDQNIRGVQTFRNPSTGGTMELSNLYDHAWLNSSNEYIMSDDSNFNPNGQLQGSWNQLEVVRAAP
jgi:cysteine rich repeat protein